ncbi:MAG: hypothetical protein ACI841_004984 [Planctomycetota bacterium]|jgi:hypothetical protein
MNIQALITSMSRFPEILSALACGTPAEYARARPRAGAWSMLEVVRHLVEEEELDFGTRTRLALEEPTTPWSGIDPEGWVTEHEYNKEELEPSLALFAERRTTSIQWLEARVTADWSSAHVHPQFEALRAGDLLAAWAAHDALHLAQLAKLKAGILGQQAGEFHTRYAMP